MSNRSKDETPYTTLAQWAKSHAGCPCTRFSDFSISQSERLVSKIECILREGLGFFHILAIPPVLWNHDADVECLAACQNNPRSGCIGLGRGSSVNWTTTLVAYVHAIWHVLSDNGDVETDRHGTEWQKTVDNIITLLTNRDGRLEDKHFSCIRDSLRF